MSTAISESTFTDVEFDSVAALYGADGSGAKFKSLVNAIAALGVDERQDHLARVDVLIGRLQDMRDNGGGYTPPSGKGFGSDNAAVIAGKILGQAQTVGATRKAFSDWGKNAR